MKSERQVDADHYLSADPQPREGLCKALSVAVGSSVTSLNPEKLDATLLIMYSRCRDSKLMSLV